MKLNLCLEKLSIAGKWITKAVFSFAAIALLWQGLLLPNLSASAAPTRLLLASTANQVKDTADEVRDRSKDLVRETKKNVKKAANQNASKVNQADDEGSFVERKALRDRSRIERRANEDAARTEKAIDNNINAVKGVVEKVKDAFGG